MAVRFHLDEHISAQIAAGLRRRKIDVTSATDAALTGSSDSEQLAYANETGRVMVTQDQDFLRLHADGVQHCGIAFCAPGPIAIGSLLRRLILIHDVLLPEEMHNRVEFL